MSFPFVVSLSNHGRAFGVPFDKLRANGLVTLLPARRCVDSMYLLDINILIALADPDHEHHVKAESFFLANHNLGWATCPITENGFVRIISSSSYPRGPDNTDAACAILKQLCAHEGHRFWPDDLSLRSVSFLPASKHLTDHYLLSLAMHRQGKLATLDRHINAALIPGGADAYVVL